jgi:hypothetical protein
LGENLPFWLLFKGPGEFLGTNMVCLLGSLRVWKGLMLIFTFKFSFEEDILAFFWIGKCFGYFIQKLGQFSPNLLVALPII